MATALECINNFEYETTMCPRRLSIILLVLLSACNAAAPSPFAGKWDVKLAPDAEAIRVQEIAYPVHLQIKVKGDRVWLKYRDQYNRECVAKAVLLLNAGQDLIFSPCGTTKHPTSYAPLHHVKRVDDTLIGVVTTSDKLFEWIGSATLQ